MAPPSNKPRLVDFPGISLQDIPNQLRQVADKIEAAGVASSAVLILSTRGGQATTYAWGERSDPLSVLGHLTHAGTRVSAGIQAFAEGPEPEGDYPAEPTEFDDPA